MDLNLAVPSYLMMKKKALTVLLRHHKKFCLRGVVHFQINIVNKILDKFEQKFYRGGISPICPTPWLLASDALQTLVWINASNDLENFTTFIYTYFHSVRKTQHFCPYHTKLPTEKMKNSEISNFQMGNVKIL